MYSIQKTAADYNRIARHFSATRQRAWAELLPFKKMVKPGARVLDWGCGNGRLLHLFADVKIEYVGVDISSKLLAIARRSAKDLGYASHAKFYCTLGRDKKFPADFFDIAFAIASLHHLPDETNRLKVLKKIYQELKPGGKLVMINWNLDSDWARNKLKKDWKKIEDNDFLIPWKNPVGAIEAERYYHNFTPTELFGLLTEAGFKIKKMDYNNATKWTDSKSGRSLVTVATKKLSV